MHVLQMVVGWVYLAVEVHSEGSFRRSMTHAKSCFRCAKWVNIRPSWAHQFNRCESLTLGRKRTHRTDSGQTRRLRGMFSAVLQGYEDVEIGISFAVL